MVKGRGLLRNERVFENALSETQKWVLGSITSVVGPGPYPYFLTTNALSETQKWVLGSITSVVGPGPYP